MLSILLYYLDTVQLGEASRRAADDAGRGSQGLVPDADAPPHDVSLAAGSVQVEHVGRSVHVSSVDLNEWSCQLGQRLKYERYLSLLGVILWTP